MKPLPKFVPVIHVVSETQALKQAEMAFGCGAGGVFLIDHGGSQAESLHGILQKVRQHHPNGWIGVNYLCLNSFDVVTDLLEGVDAVWVDDGGLRERHKPEEQFSALVLSNRAKENGAGKDWRLFAGVAFKYQEPVQDVGGMAKMGSDLFCVVTTSGAATGQAAPVEKIMKMKGEIGEKPLALASGVTLLNVKDYMPYVDCFMVATGISEKFDGFDPVKIQKMAEILACR